jgi:hypothetical protein
MCSSSFATRVKDGGRGAEGKSPDVVVSKWLPVGGWKK